MVGATMCGAGAAYLFRPNTGTQLRKFTASDGMSSNDFGYSVDLDGHLAIVGAPSNNTLPQFTGRPGAAYIYDTNTGVETKLTPSDSSAVMSLVGRWRLTKPAWPSVHRNEASAWGQLT